MQTSFKNLMNNPAASKISKLSPPLTGGDEGEGEKSYMSTPTLTLPHQGGGSKWRPCSKLTGNNKFNSKNLLGTSLFAMLTKIFRKPSVKGTLRYQKINFFTASAFSIMNYLL
jgi:hypothetical protein